MNPTYGSSLRVASFIGQTWFSRLGNLLVKQEDKNFLSRTWDHGLSLVQLSWQANACWRSVLYPTQSGTLRHLEQHFKMFPRILMCHVHDAHLKITFIPYILRRKTRHNLPIASYLSWCFTIPGVQSSSRTIFSLLYLLLTGKVTTSSLLEAVIAPPVARRDWWCSLEG